MALVQSALRRYDSQESDLVTRMGYLRDAIRPLAMSFLSGILFLAAACTPVALEGQTKPAQPQPSQTPPPQAQNQPMGPPAPKSTHFPILLIAVGTAPDWGARIGMKGLEGLERGGYPPINLVPGDVTQDAASMSWTYHATDGDTGAAVTGHLVRETCTVGTSDVKYAFKIELDHAQIGVLQGCARMEPEQFPEFKQKNLDDDDPDKKPIGPPPITNFKPPISYAYLEASGRVVLRRRGVTLPVAERGSQLSVSHDGNRVLYTREEGGTSAVWMYDAVAKQRTEWLGGGVQRAFWSPDDTRVAFLRAAGTGWQIWIAPADAPGQAAQAYPGEVTSLDGWSGAHTLLASDANNFYWVGDSGGVFATLAAKDLYGDQFSRPATDDVRVNPANPDLLLVSAPIVKPGAGTPTDSRTGLGGGFFLYEVKSKRRVLLSPPDAFATAAGWSLDGIQIFYTNREGRGTVVDRIFWDGSAMKRYAAGSDLVVGQ
jgi:uncharacterized membrane protein